MISFGLTVKLVCAVVFAYADCWFSDAAAQIGSYIFTVQLILPLSKILLIAKESVVLFYCSPIEAVRNRSAACVSR